MFWERWKQSWSQYSKQFCSVAQSAKAVDYTECISAEGYDLPTNECSGYDIKQFDGEAPGMQSTSSLPGSLWAGVVAPDRVLSMAQVEQFDIQTVCKWTTYANMNCLK